MSKGAQHLLCTDRNMFLLGSQPLRQKQGLFPGFGNFMAALFNAKISNNAGCRKEDEQQQEEHFSLKGPAM
jgi:hypothetical protein